MVVLLGAVGIWSWMAKPWEGWYMPAQAEQTKSGLHIARFDRVLDEYVSLGSYTALHQMNTEYPRQTKLLIEDVLKLGKVDDPDIEKHLRYFYLDSTVQVLLDEVHHQYSDLSDIERSLQTRLEQLKKRYPNYHRPAVYAQISCLNQSVVVADTLIGISLDKYLGADFSIYHQYYSEEQCQEMVRSAIVDDVIAAYEKYLIDDYERLLRIQVERSGEPIPYSR